MTRETPAEHRLYVSGLVFVEWSGTFSDLRHIVAEAVGAPLQKDTSGDFEDFPAWQCRLCNIYLALLDRPIDEQPRATLFQVQVLTDVPFGPADLNFADISSNLKHVLEKQGLTCSCIPPDGYYWLAMG